MSTKIWILLIMLTFITFSMGYFEFIAPLIIGMILLSIFIKGQLISDYFMGLKEVKLRYRIIPTLWLVIVLSLIAYTYFFPKVV